MSENNDSEDSNVRRDSKIKKKIREKYTKKARNKTNTYNVPVI